MGIMFIFNDIDGCIGNFSKPKYPNKQDIALQYGSLLELKKMSKLLNASVLSVATARSVHESDNIIHTLDYAGKSICEMGNIIYSPNDGEIRTCDFAPLPRNVKMEICDFYKWRSETDFDALVRDKFPNTGAKMLKDRKHMLTFEFEANVSVMVLGWIKEYLLPEWINKLIERDILRVYVSRRAIDITTFLDKLYAIDAIVTQLGHTLSDVLAIGDSEHSDYHFMERCGYCACPSNADEKIRMLVASKGFNGYVSNMPYIDGNLDIIRHTVKFWK